MTETLPVRFHIRKDQYKRFKGMSTAFYKKGVIPIDNVNALAKLALFKLDKEWKALEKMSEVNEAQKQQETRYPPPVLKPVSEYDYAMGGDRNGNY